jgi:hypothetical protein
MLQINDHSMTLIKTNSTVVVFCLYKNYTRKILKSSPWMHFSLSFKQHSLKCFKLSRKTFRRNGAARRTVARRSVVKSHFVRSVRCPPVDLSSLCPRVVRSVRRPVRRRTVFFSDCLFELSARLTCPRFPELHMQ